MPDLVFEPSRSISGGDSFRSCSIKPILPLESELCEPCTDYTAGASGSVLAQEGRVGRAVVDVEEFIHGIKLEPACWSFHLSTHSPQGLCFVRYGYVTLGEARGGRSRH